MSKSILSTLLYHSVFDYPLTLGEIHRYLISAEPISLPIVKREINNLVKAGKVYSRNGFFLPLALSPHPLSLIKLRQRRKSISQKKLMIAERASRIISIIPWVKMIAVTGALAMENADKNDDIDLMVVTSRNRLWIVRPLAMILTSVFFKRRKPVIKGLALDAQGQALSKTIPDVSNSICLNLWLDESALEIPVDQRNLYTAHELAQMKPVVNKEKTYEKILIQNRWGEKFLANFWQLSLRVPPRRGVAIPLGSFTSFRMTAGNFLNSFLFHLQFIYMKSKMTNERVSLHSAFFHPGNRTDTILGRYDSLRHRYF